jgi:hypothetical protein
MPFSDPAKIFESKIWMAIGRWGLGGAGEWPPLAHYCSIMADTIAGKSCYCRWSGNSLQI